VRADLRHRHSVYQEGALIMAMAFTSTGARIAWDSFGDPAHPALVLIQGLTAQMVGWRPGFCQRLADEGFHVIRYDNRDVGESQRYPQGGYSLADFADDTAELLSALKLDSAHIAGQSMGGMIAQWLWQRHPSRVRSLGLIYTAATGNHYGNRDDALERMNRPIPQTREAFAAYYAEGEAMCRSTAYPQDVAWLTELGGVVWDRSWDEAGTARQVEVLLSATDRVDIVRTITVPTVIIAGDADQLINATASKELHQLIPGSTLKIFEGMGHEVPEPLWGEMAALLAANARIAEGRMRR
jgi:pimeloyl-ACP methyl ester carboxylesterase